jgi:uncharacterized protein
MLVDTNLLVYATFADAPEHPAARGWLESRLQDGEGTLVLCWPVIYAFLRLVTSRRIFGGQALALQVAWSAVPAYLGQPAIRIVTPGPGHAEIAGELARTPGLRSEDVPDIEVAALAIEHGLVLATHDSGFRRFAALRVVDPIS